MTTSNRSTMTRLVRVFFFSLFLLPFVFGATSTTYSTLGADNENTNALNHNMAADTDAFNEYLFNYPESISAGADFQPLTGDMDGDDEIEFLLPTPNEYNVYTIRNNNLFKKYEFLKGNGVRGPKPLSPNTAVLFDIDSDGDKELIYCGSENDVEKITAFEFNGTHSTLILEHNLTFQHTNVDSDSCSLKRDAGGARPNTTFTPKALRHDGEPWALFIVSADGTQIGEMNIVKLNLNNASTIEYQPKNVVAAACGNMFAPGVNSAVIDNYKPLSYDSEAYSPNIIRTNSFALCEDHTDSSNKVAYIPVDCNKGSGDTRGIFAYDFRTSVVDTDFDTGYVALGQSGDIMSSPSCMTTSAGEVSRIVAAKPSSNTIEIYDSNGAGMELVEGEGVTTDFTSISNIFQGEFNSNTLLYDDVCITVFNHPTKTSAIYCVDIDDPFTLFQNEVYAEANITGITFHRTWVHTPIQNPSAVAGTFGNGAFSDFFIQGGFYSADPSSASSNGLGDFKDNVGFDLTPERAFRLDFTIPPQDGTCTLSDLDRDGYTDVLCFNSDRISYYSPSTINNRVDLLSVGLDVASGQMCVGNQTFFIQGGYYTDVEKDDVRVLYSCDNNATETTLPYKPFGGAFSFTCPYTTGLHNARISMQDRGSMLLDTVVIPTSVSNSTECIVPDSFESGIFQDEPEEEVVTPGDAVLPAPKDLIDQLFVYLNVDENDAVSKDILIFLLMFGLSMTALATAAKHSKHGAAGPVAFALVFFGVLTVATVTGYLRPIYLFSLLMLSALGITIGVFIFGRR